MDILKYYRCKTRPDWYRIDDGFDGVLVQIEQESIAILDSEKARNLSFSQIKKTEFDKILEIHDIPRLLAFLK